MSSNLMAFRDTIATSELTARLLLVSDNGYNVLCGSTADHPRLFSSYIDHPRQLIDLPKLGIKSSAAGRYQIKRDIYDAYRAQLRLADFSPASQDTIATQLIRERHALDDIEAGRFDAAIAKCATCWASLPGATYGQHVNDIADLRRVYLRAGGTLA